MGGSHTSNFSVASGRSFSQWLSAAVLQASYDPYYTGNMMLRPAFSSSTTGYPSQSGNASPGILLLALLVERHGQRKDRPLVIGPQRADFWKILGIERNPSAHVWLVLKVACVFAMLQCSYMTLARVHKFFLCCKVCIDAFAGLPMGALFTHPSRQN